MEWYRTSDWDEAAQEDFEKRLRRARSSRPQYLRIKALALQDAGMPHDAETLIRRLLAEHPEEEFERPFALELLDDLVRTQDRLGEAEVHYREALATGDSGATTGLVAVSLAEVLTEAGRPEEAWALLHSATAETETLQAFDHARFRWLTACARAADALQDQGAAVQAATDALALVGAPDQYARHPGVGAVRVDEATLSSLRRLAVGIDGGGAPMAAVQQERIGL